MERIKCVIVDDESSVLKTLKRFVQQISQLDLQATFTDPLAAKEFIRKSEVDLVFLDISMDSLSGIDLAKLITNKIVFITGHEEFALQAWKLDNVVGYLTKPIFFEDIVGIVKRVSNLFPEGTNDSLINSDKYLSYKYDDSIVKIEFDNIIYIEAKRNYSVLFMDGKETDIPIPLWEIEKSLPKGKFIRVNKSSIANMNKIVDEGCKEILLMGGLKLKPGKAYKMKN